MYVAQTFVLTRHLKKLAQSKNRPTWSPCSRVSFFKHLENFEFPVHTHLIFFQ
jgi:hypothetical protein